MGKMEPRRRRLTQLRGAFSDNSSVAVLANSGVGQGVYIYIERFIV